MVPLFSPRTGPSRLRTAKLRGASSSAISTVMFCSRRPMRRVTTARVPTATGPSPILSARTTPPCHSGRCEGSVTYANTSSGLREISMLATMGAIACLLPGDETSMIPHLGTARYGRGVGLLPAERESHGHGIRAGWEPDRCQRRRKALQTLLFSIRSRGDLRSSWPDRSLAGISGYDRLCAGIPVRDLRGMKTSRRSSAPNPATKHADLQRLYGSDGTRTRDLRRDRPVLALA